MRNKKRTYGAETAFLDLLFNSLLGFVSLFFLAFILINPKVVSDAKIKSKAEFMITIEWAPDSDDDVDGYLEDPLGNLVFFSSREDGLMHLDRDDRGIRSDRIRSHNNEEMVIKDNREIITIRGIVPGEYTMNVHMYRKRDKGPIKVKVLIQKLNPQVVEIVHKEVELNINGDEKTICRFELNKDGDVVKKNFIFKKLATVVARYENNNYNDEEDYDEDGNYIDPEGDG